VKRRPRPRREYRRRQGALAKQLHGIEVPGDAHAIRAEMLADARLRNQLFELLLERVRPWLRLGVGLLLLIAALIVLVVAWAGGSTAAAVTAAGVTVVQAVGLAVAELRRRQAKEVELEVTPEVDPNPAQLSLLGPIPLAQVRDNVPVSQR
jgi:hypothetical protein